MDDYSYAQVRDQLVGNLRITAYYNGVLIAGIEPVGASVEPSRELSVRLLGNPVVGGILEAEVTGAEGQPLTLQLLDMQGRTLSRHGIEAAMAS